ncbi:MAG: glycoside hydrolase family 3 N-terminal domain-containing protein [Bacillota bacterium]|nr:glycoside hydrolase family 3 N-terminal domain-containing protein [Bacillota bacterium]
MTDRERELDQVCGRLRQLSLSQRIRLLGGRNSWQTEAIPQLGIPALVFSDGPHGLRYQPSGHDSLREDGTEEATLFPTAGTLAASWDEELLALVGGAIATEALAQQVHVVLGPGVNLRRHPRGGRNFEYYSEDPLLSARLGAAWVRGCQERGVGVSLKHFAANNQEHRRMVYDAVVDPRALRELYLAAFEAIVRERQPETVMLAYNRLNGVPATGHRLLVERVLRGDWGFRGLAISDWGATVNRAEALAAGMDLEMPGSGGSLDFEVDQALRDGEITEREVDLAVARTSALALRLARQRSERVGDLPPPEQMYREHAALAVEAACRTAVLLKNEAPAEEGGRPPLPLAVGRPVCLLGALARRPHVQGGGSSHVRPRRQSTLLEALPRRLAAQVTYQPGYRLDGLLDEALLDEALEAAAAAVTAGAAVVLVLGLADADESEGYDRPSLELPAGQSLLLERLLEQGIRPIVLLQSGSVLLVPWLDRVPALLLLGLAGQGGGEAAARLLLGVNEPTGRLTETWPLAAEDLAADGSFAKAKLREPYRESFYVGYRYTETAKVPVRFPFGYGLGYGVPVELLGVEALTESGEAVPCVQLPALQGPEVADAAVLPFRVKVLNPNPGPAVAVVQTYLEPLDPDPDWPVPRLVLCDFARLQLAGESGAFVDLALGWRQLAAWNEGAGGWQALGGRWRLRLGRDVRDASEGPGPALEFAVEVLGETPPAPELPVPDWYREPVGQPQRWDFWFLLKRDGRERLLDEDDSVFSLETPLEELVPYALSARLFAWLARAVILLQAGILPFVNDAEARRRQPGLAMQLHAMREMPLRAFPLFSRGLTPRSWLAWIVRRAERGRQRRRR